MVSYPKSVASIPRRGFLFELFTFHARKLIYRFALAVCPERETINQATLITIHPPLSTHLSPLTSYYN